MKKCKKIYIYTDYIKFIEDTRVCVFTMPYDRQGYVVYPQGQHTPHRYKYMVNMFSNIIDDVKVHDNSNNRNAIIRHAAQIFSERVQKKGWEVIIAEDGYGRIYPRPRFWR